MLTVIEDLLSVLQECGCRLKALQESMVAVRSEFETKCKHLEEALKSEKCVFVCFCCRAYVDKIYAYTLYIEMSAVGRLASSKCLH